MQSDCLIERTYLDTKTHQDLSFNEVLDNSISVILGEPASGKTHQLEHYNTLNYITSSFVELLTLDESDLIEESIDIVLLDSIDEALSKNDIDKALKKKLSKYIKDCREINPNIKFVITGRYVEWKEIFG